MFMRHFGGGIGHGEWRPTAMEPTPEDAELDLPDVVEELVVPIMVPSVTPQATAPGRDIIEEEEESGSESEGEENRNSNSDDSDATDDDDEGGYATD
jgi:hypothetical protein